MTALGLASRRYATLLPQFIAFYAGDTLWALMAFIAIGVAAPTWSTWRVLWAALGVAYAVEASQLYHAAWIDRVRATWLGGVTLGYGFLWSDLACYAVGVAAGAGSEFAIAARARPSPLAARRRTSR